MKMFRLFILLMITLSYSTSKAEPTKNQIIVITHVNVWDGMGNSLKNNYQILIEGNHIKQVAPRVTIPDGAKIIDGKGNTLIPGLSDAHLHLMFTMPMDKAYNNANWVYLAIRATKMAEQFLMQGFTTIRDMGGPVQGLKQAIDEGLIPGPRIYSSGAIISQTAGHGDMRNPNDMNPHWTGNNANFFQLQGWSYIVDGRSEILNAVRENFRHGATQIKMMAGGGIASKSDPIHTIQFTKEELEAGVQAASDWGTYVGVHVYTPTAIIRALNAGVKSIEHGQLIDEEAMKMIKEKDAFLVPQSYWTTRNPETSSNPQKFLEVRKGTENEMNLAKKYGVKVAFGSDVFGNLGIAPQSMAEFTSRVRWYTPVEVLKQATSLNAELFALSGNLNPYPDGELGVIKEGAYADLLIYEGNPLQDIQVVVDFQKNLKFIMKDGKIYKNEL